MDAVSFMKDGVSWDTFHYYFPKEWMFIGLAGWFPNPKAALLLFMILLMFHFFLKGLI